MRGTLPAARKQQRYVAARTRFVGFARRGPICMIARGGRVRFIPYLYVHLGMALLGVVGILVLFNFIMYYV